MNSQIHVIKFHEITTTTYYQSDYCSTIKFNETTRNKNSKIMFSSFTVFKLRRNINPLFCLFYFSLNIQFPNLKLTNFWINTQLYGILFWILNFCHKKTIAAFVISAATHKNCHIQMLILISAFHFNQRKNELLLTWIIVKHV